jgi:hypothetical protein
MDEFSKAYLKDFRKSVSIMLLLNYTKIVFHPLHISDEIDEEIKTILDNPSSNDPEWLLYKFMSIAKQICQLYNLPFKENTEFFTIQ